MEFGIFSNGYIPGPAAHDTESEHTELMRESEYAVIADRNNWKYMVRRTPWLSRIQPHVSTRTTYGLGRSTNRTHTYRLRHH